MGSNGNEPRHPILLRLVQRQTALRECLARQCYQQSGGGHAHDEDPHLGSSSCNRRHLGKAHERKHVGRNQNGARIGKPDGVLGSAVIPQAS